MISAAPSNRFGSLRVLVHPSYSTRAFENQSIGESCTARGNGGALGLDPDPHSPVVTAMTPPGWLLACLFWTGYTPDRDNRFALKNYLANPVPLEIRQNFKHFKRNLL